VIQPGGLLSDGRTDLDLLMLIEVRNLTNSYFDWKYSIVLSEKNHLK
jgi:hypothetical protein